MRDAKDRADAVVARTLGISQDKLHDDLEYQSIQQWDSLRHVALMLALEEAFSIKVDEMLMLELHSVRAIREYVAGLDGGEKAPDTQEAAARAVVAETAGKPHLHRGLVGVYFDRSAISMIDGEHGVLEYRGYSIHDLATRCSFEDIIHLLLHARLPGPAERAALAAEISRARTLPEPVMAVMRQLAHAHPMEALRTGVSMLGAYDPDAGNLTREALLRSGVRLIAQVPILVALHHRSRQGLPFVSPDAETPFAAHLLHMLQGVAPSEFSAGVIDRDLIVHADHSSNASTFALRVVAGCRSSLHAGMTTAIAAFAGMLHGGAAEEVMHLIDEVGAREAAADYVQRKHANNEPVMGFGHRVYRTEDPRVRHLRDAALTASKLQGDMHEYEVVQAVVEAMRPYARHGVDANVDLYAGLAYRKLGLPDDLAVPGFVIGGMAGWLAHAVEQFDNNVLIRPLLEYVGPTGLPFPDRSASS
ncbi:MAG: citrate (Si)-synthase [Lysobacteraceae bacterium]|nr:MAG: citrate (Si)-synthase [Xanthomonadaceae bacterium]